ncbi:PD-(D/E)XK nuclease family protein [Lamprocystis purpurea]|uniref:PD-(D/E)XK nuclease family protein n=1 Tax=Lamprocystis purpurea TaxID=61598 RepID=UPI00037D6EFE|nr:DUF3782 domain-containing protein [Lamprocystis purpurea]
MDITVETIKRELPRLLREDPELRHYLLEIARGHFADRVQTDDRFDRVLDELRRDREEQARKWDEQTQLWREQNRKWDEQNREQRLNWDEQNRKWEEQNRKWDEQNREQKLNRDEQNRKWEESRREFDRVHEEIMAQAKKHDRSIGALGARWGLQSEAAFRNALAGILETSFGVSVRNVCEFDDAGEVFGRPDQVEIDIIVKNGMLLLMELKSSIDKSGMYIFERKARFYERHHNRKADRLIVISPMIDPRAIPVAQALGIETYGDSLDVPVE